MRDFTLDSYRSLLINLKESGYHFCTFEEYLKKENPSEKFVILRHDVDKKPGNALHIAEIEHKINLQATYYFRVRNGTVDEDIIKKIINLKHEIGYHYEDFSFRKGNFELAIKSFELNLEKIRTLFPVKTICMHGNPLSKWDNRKLWNKFDYRDFGIRGEPYFDMDFQRIMYLTDTGRRWDGEQMNVRDRVIQETGENSFHSTGDIIRAARQGLLPNQIMFNTHPQRWTNSFLPWIGELVAQNLKNILKKYWAR